MGTKRTTVVAAAAVAMLVLAEGTPARAQILYNKIEPRKPGWREIQPKGYRAEPYRTMSAPSKPYAPMPHFHNRNILPDRIRLAPPTQHNIEPKHIRPDWTTFNPMIKQDIKPERIRLPHQVHAMSPGLHMTAPPTLARPHWSFDLTMEAPARPTTRFDSSLKMPLPDYDAPNRQRVVVPPGMSHPMSW